MYCPHCNELINDRAIFCKHCYRRVRRRLWPKLVFLLILVGCATGVNYLFLVKKVPVSAVWSACTRFLPSKTTQTKSIDFKSVLPALVRVETEDNSGSGFIISEDGLVITSLHVLGKSKKALVHFHDGTAGLANVRKTAEEGDLVLLKIDSTRKYAFVELGDSTTLNPAQEVTVIGFPLGIETAVTTKGIVSAAPIFLPGVKLPLIQIDASVNPGNSGGPLLNSSGKVVGVVAAKLLGAESMNWVVPINYASRFEIPNTDALKTKEFDLWKQQAMEKWHDAPKDTPKTAPEPASRHGSNAPAAIKIRSASRSANTLTVTISLLDENSDPIAANTNVTLEASWPPYGHCVTIQHVMEKDFSSHGPEGIFQTERAKGPPPQAAIELRCPEIPPSSTVTISARCSGGSVKDTIIVH